MKICLDLRYKTESGASSYIKNLVPSLLKNDKENEYIFIKYPKQSFGFEKKEDTVIISPCGNSIIQIMWDMFVLPLRLYSCGVSLYHPLKNPGPAWGLFKKVFTVHSINIDYKGTFPTSFRRHLYHTLYTNYFTKKCNRVIAVSGFLKDFIVERLHIDRKYVDVIYHGIDSRFQKLPKTKVAAILKRYNLPDNYILSVGNITPVKNHLTTIKAFASIKDKITENYVIIGSTKDCYFQKVFDYVGKNDLKERIFLPGFIPSNDLPAIMNGAKLLLFPSLTEGCPVTMLEAFACGLPVIASRRGGLEDLGKNCTSFVDNPEDTEAFAVLLEKMLKSEDDLENFSKLVLAKAQNFSWDTTALNHIKTYKNIFHSQGF